MAMSSKNYIETANVIKFEVKMATGLTPVRKTATITAIQSIATGLADMFAADNRHFNRARFMTACGLGDPNGN